MYFKILGLTTFCLLSIVILVFLILNSGSDRELEGVMDKGLQAKDIIFLLWEQTRMRAGQML